ncbi:MAG: hypothetical protein IJO04_01950 [Oscillospiraceae bacterium]|nr:hypothetical protein [Oscillospiraceae bacterium]
MKKLYIALSLILSLCFVFAGCDVDTDDETITVSGDIAYYAEMDEDALEEKCKGNYIEVSGTVHIIYQNIGKIYIGNNLSDKIQFSCDLSDSDDTVNIEKGDLVTIRGKCSSCIGSTVYLQNCEVEKHSNKTESESTAPTGEAANTPTTESSTVPNTEPATAPTTEPPHTHSFSAATCTTPKTCSCGATAGKANGHNWKDATCSDPKMCTVCGTTSGLTAGHNFSNGKCTTCGKADPDYYHETMVWIPTNGGTKYHTHAGCSNMEDPEQVTQSEAESRGFTPCKRCH